MGMAGVLEAAVGTGGAGGGDAAVGGRGAAAWEEEEGEAREGRRRREGLEAGAEGSAVRRASRSRRLMRCEPGLLLLLLLVANKAWKTCEVSEADSCRPRRTRPPLRPLRLTKPATTRA